MFLLFRIVTQVKRFGGDCKKSDGKVSHNISYFQLAIFPPVVSAYLQSHDIGNMETDIRVERQFKFLITFFKQLRSKFVFNVFIVVFPNYLIFCVL